MRQALHIFMKDLCGLRVWLTAWSALLLVYAVVWSFGPVPSVWQWNQGNSMGAYLSWFVAGAWVYLTIAVVLLDPLPGTRGYWLTRPVNRWSLLGAKAIFIVTVLCLPTMVTDIVICSFRGVAGTVTTGGVLQHQAGMLLYFVLPAALVASLSIGLGQAILGVWLGWSLIIVGFLGVDRLCGLLRRPTASQGFHWNNWSEMMSLVPGVLLGLAALILQYRRRRTGRNLLLAHCAFVAVPIAPVVLPVDFSFEMERWQLGGSGGRQVQISMAESPPLVGVSSWKDAQIDLKIEAKGLASDEILRAGFVKSELDFVDQGRRVVEAIYTPSFATLQGSGGHFAFTVPHDLYKRLAGREFSILAEGHASILVEREWLRVPATFGEFRLADGSVCNGSSDPGTGGYELNCRRGLSAPRFVSQRLIHPDNPNVAATVISLQAPSLLALTPQGFQRIWLLTRFQTQPLVPFGSMFELRRWDRTSGEFAPYLDPAKLPQSEVAFSSMHMVAMFPMKLRIDGVRLGERDAAQAAAPEVGKSGLR